MVIYKNRYPGKYFSVLRVLLAMHYGYTTGHKATYYQAASGGKRVCVYVLHSLSFKLVFGIVEHKFWSLEDMIKFDVISVLVS